LMGVGEDKAMIIEVKTNAFDGRASGSTIDGFMKVFVVGGELDELVKGSACEDIGHVEATLYFIMIII
jgi:hypothetical protein